VSGGASSLVDRAAAAAFVLGLAALVFGYGFLAGKRGLPPHDQVAAMEEAANAFYKTYLQPASRAAGDLLLPARDAGRAAEARAYAHDPARTAPGPTFLTLYTKEGFEARLVAPDGAVLHRWRVSHSQAFPEPRHLLWKAPDEFIVWHGAKPYPNGDVVFNFQDKSFPYGGGLVRLDKDSRVVWALPENTHHDVEADPGDGSLWVPGMRYRPEGLPEVPGMKPWFYEDTVLRVSADGGEVLGEVSVLKALAASYPGLLSINYEDHLRLEAQDPLHLNAAEPLPAALAPTSPASPPATSWSRCAASTRSRWSTPAPAGRSGRSPARSRSSTTRTGCPAAGSCCSTTGAATRPAAAAGSSSSTTPPRR
jgi:hypothetical protein